MFLFEHKDFLVLVSLHQQKPLSCGDWESSPVATAHHRWGSSGETLCLDLSSDDDCSHIEADFALHMLGNDLGDFASGYLHSLASAIDAPHSMRYSMIRPVAQESAVVELEICSTD